MGAVYFNWDGCHWWWVFNGFFGWVVWDPSASLRMTGWGWVGWGPSASLRMTGVRRQDDRLGWQVRRLCWDDRGFVILAKAGIHLWVDGPQPSLGRRCFAGAALFRWDDGYFVRETEFAIDCHLEWMWEIWWRSLVASLCRDDRLEAVINPSTQILTRLKVRHILTR